MSSKSTTPELLLAAFADQLDTQISEEAFLRMRDRLRQRISASDDLHVLPADQGQWHALGDLIKIKFLRRDTENNSQTTIWELAPNAIIAPHAHSSQEECLILQGEISYQGNIYRAGDYLLAEAGEAHEPFHSLNGARLLIRGELSYLPEIFWR